MFVSCCWFAYFLFFSFSAACGHQSTGTNTPGAQPRDRSLKRFSNLWVNNLCLREATSFVAVLQLWLVRTSLFQMTAQPCHLLLILQSIFEQGFLRTREWYLNDTCMLAVFAVYCLRCRLLLSSSNWAKTQELRHETVATRHKLSVINVPSDKQHVDLRTCQKKRNFAR